MDEFLTTMAESRAAFNDDGEQPELDHHHCLDPLLEVLAKFRSSADLTESIQLMYARLDVDGSGGVGMAEMRDGLPQIINGIQFTLEDWYHIAEEVLKLRREEATKENEDAEGSGRPLSRRGSEFENLGEVELTLEVCERASTSTRVSPLLLSQSLSLRAGMRERSRETTACVQLASSLQIVD